MNLKVALPLLALLPSACAGTPNPPQPILALAEQRRCPPYPLPPEALLKRPVQTDFFEPSD